MGRYVGHRKGRTIFKVVSVVLVIVLASVIAVEGLIFSGQKTTAEPRADILIVLGAGLQGRTPSQLLKLRLDAALKYLNENEETVAILSGGQGSGEDISEAEAMRIYLEGKGIDPGRLVMENKSRNTSQNMKYSKEIIDSFGLNTPSIVVTSQGFHLYRAGRLAKRNGMDVTVLAAETVSIWSDIKCRAREYVSVILMFLGR